MSGNHKALHARSRIQDAINARLEEISFRKGVTTGTSALLFLVGLGVAATQLTGQGSPASGAVNGQASGAPLSAVTTHPGPASAPGSAVPSQSRRPHAQPRPSSHPVAGRLVTAPAPVTSVPGRDPGTGGTRASAPAVSASPSAGPRSGSGSWRHGGRSWDGWHHGERGWDGWGQGGGDPWHGGRHW